MRFLGCVIRGFGKSLNIRIPQMCQPSVHEREDEVAAVVYCPLLPGQLGRHGGLPLQPLRIAGPQRIHPYKAGK